MGRDAAPSRDRPRDPQRQRIEVRAHGRADRVRPPREVRRLGLSERAGRRPHPALRAHRRGGRRVRRAHLRAAVQEGLGQRAGVRVRRQPGGAAFRSAHGRSLHRHEEGSDASADRLARSSRGAGQALSAASQTAPSGILGALRARLKARPDSEHEQALVRLANAVLFRVYLVSDLHETPVLWVGYLAYFCAGVAIVAAILLRPAASPLRRTLGAALDATMITWTLMYFGEAGAPLYLVYLWITLANGFRYGANYLLITLAFCVTGFGLDLAFSHYWIEHRTLGVGLLVGLLVLSLYVKTLVTRLFDALARAEQANQAKRRFISVVSHDRRTPLNAIIGMADLLRDTTLSRAQAAVFESVTQGGQTPRRRFGGGGLGAVSGEQLVGLMGGRIGMESAAGVARTFWFELALEKQPERAGGARELAGGRVLLVGCPSAEGHAMGDALVGWGAVPVHVASVEDGVARLVAEISVANPYHGVLIYAATKDLKFAERVRRSAPDPAPPCVLAVARELQGPRFEAPSAGFAAVLELPFDKRQLFNVLHSIAAGRQGREGGVRLTDHARRGPGAGKSQKPV